MCILNKKLLFCLTLGLLSSKLATADDAVVSLNSNYQSTYNAISWDKRGTDTEYCLDIADDNGNSYESLNPITCGNNLTSFSPIDYVNNIAHTTLPDGFAFRWKVLSRTVNAEGQTVGQPNYAGNGYEGRVVVDALPHCSNAVDGLEATTDPNDDRGVADIKKKWPNGTVLKYATDFTGVSISDFSYVCNRSDSGQNCVSKIIARIQERASLWSSYGNIRFEYTPNWNAADIRITFTKAQGAYSVIGTDARAQSGNTMNLDASWWGNPWIDTTITHEFGHAIGFLHEHLRSDYPYLLDENAVYALYAKHGWSNEQTYYNVLKRININSSAYFSTTYDDKSIMRYSLERNLVKNKEICPSKRNDFCVEPNTQLSELDKVAVAKLYSGAPSGTQSIRVGSKGPAGGIIFYVDSTGAHGLEAQTSDLGDAYSWSQAVNTAQQNGWHLPTKNELNLLYQQKNVVGASGGSYWSSSGYGTYMAWYQNFNNGGQYVYYKDGQTSIRAVKTF